MPPTSNRPIQFKLPRRPDKLTAGLLVGFVVVAGVTAVLAFVFVKDLVASWTMTDLGGVNIQPGEVTGNNPQVEGTVPPGPLQPALGPTPQPWDGVSRVNILFVGLDYRDWEAGEIPRTDTMILFTVDPLSKTAGALSIPRDMWVNVPRYGYFKINTAYFLGERDKLPGGGPGLAMRTVEEFIGVPIHYYAQVDFSAFTQLVDTLGGVEIEVPEEIKVDPIGPNNTVILQPGRQLLNGEVLLGYARNRYDGSDFARASRQQQVIMAIRDKVVGLDMLPTLIGKAPALYQQLSAGIHTNLDLQQVIQLALLVVQDIPRENIRQAVIGQSEVTFGKSPDGLDILKPITDKIRIKRDDIFTTGGPVGPSLSGDPVELMKGEAARVQVFNGTYTAGLGGRTSEYLAALGASMLEPGNADEVTLSTAIYDYTGKPYTVRYLVDLMHIDPNRIFNRYDPNAQVDVTVVLGADWANTNSMP
jgi:LCP family protein required for cell wall assembly